jgi:N-acetylglucosamine-6-phosphate deacetylase
MIAYTNATIYTGVTIENDKAVLVSDGVIVDVVHKDAIPSQYAMEDLRGLNLAPAFIDLQLYGGNGRLFSQELNVQSLQATYDYCVAGGCKHFMITLATNTISTFLLAFEAARAYQSQGGKGLLGIHLEGPYINPVKKGAHLADCIKKPTVEEVSMLLEKGAGIFKMMTLAPEQCDADVIKLLLQHGIILSAGHTNATYGQAMEAFTNGIPAATHLFNAMSPLQHREPGMVGAIFDHPTVMSSLVCDGIHVDFAAVRIAKQVMRERLFFITDAVTGVTGGEYEHVLAKDHYTLPNGTLSGSALTMMQCVINGVQQVGIALDEALRMAAAYPAQLLHTTMGKIQKGYAADFVVFDKALQVQRVY